MKKPIILFAIIMLCGLGYQLNQAANAKAQIADTMLLLATTKEHARARWTNQPDPTNLFVLTNPLSWGINLEAQFHARGTLDANRLLQLTLPRVPEAVCADILQTLIREQAEGLWLRVDINAAEAPAPLDLAARKRLCAGAPNLSVYFRF